MTDILPVVTLPTGKRFINCGLVKVDPNEGRRMKVSIKRVKQLWGSTMLPEICRRDYDIPILPVYQAIFASEENLPGFTLEDFEVLEIQCFKHKVEKGSGAVYNFSRVERLGVPEHRGLYVYFVVDVISRPGAIPDGDDNQQFQYHLRGISIPLPNLVPEDGWCNNPENWHKFRED